MSDTPKTDSRAGDVNYKGNFVYCDDGQLVEIEFARQLERENVALNETTKKHVSAYYELMAENAALRIERNRYRATVDDIAELAGVWASDKMRAALGKEAQP